MVARVGKVATGELQQPFRSKNNRCKAAPCITSLIAEPLSQKNLKTARASSIRLNFQKLFDQPNRESAEAFLKKWYFWATHSRLEPIIKVAKTIKNTGMAS